MKNLRFVGLDVHAATIAVAVGEPGGEVRSLGVIPNRPESVRRLIGKLGKPEQLRVCYEAGPTGYVLYWQLTELGVHCDVVAPTLVPVKAGDRVKTDRRDAEKLARCHRAGDLTAVWVPDAAHEALSLEAVDGLLCALIASPRAIMSHEYLPVILGGSLGEAGMLDDFAQVQKLMGLLMRYWNFIAHDFEHETVHLAYIEEPGVDGIMGRDWARGYMRGTRLAFDEWGRIFNDDREGLLLAVPLVAGEMDPEWPKEPVTPERNDELLRSMLAGTARAYRYFKEDRIAYAMAAVRSEPYERAGPKVGRNDPYPCGSGKKYKRCCGGAEAPDAGVH